MTTMTYGGYSFSPVPILNINKVYNKTGDSQYAGFTYQYTLDGTLTSVPANTGGYPYMDALQDALEAAVDTDGELFLVQCDGYTAISGYPRITSLNFTPTRNNWTQTQDFTITLELDGEVAGVSPYLKGFSESWTVEFNDAINKFEWGLSGTYDQEPGTYYGIDTNPYNMRVTHNVSAVGKRHYTAAGLDQPAWKEAREYVVGQLGFNTEIAASSGVLNLSPLTFNEHNYIRSNTVDEAAGQFAASESWVVLNTGTDTLNGATETFTVNTSKTLESDITSVSIQGTINGLDVKNYGTTTGDYDVTTTKYDGAITYWDTVQARLYSRCQYASTGVLDRDLNPIRQQRSIGHNPVQGTVSYSYTYDDRPSNCIAGALTESIEVSDENPTDVFASITVLGRAAGPILQPINTTTSPSRTVSVNVNMGVPTGCTPSAMFTTNPGTQVDTLLCQFENEIGGSYSQYFKTRDNEVWNPKTGRYSRVVSWTMEDCNFDGNTSLC